MLEQQEVEGLILGGVSGCFFKIISSFGDMLVFEYSMLILCLKLYKTSLDNVKSCSYVYCILL